MRVVSGSAKGRKLLAVPGDSTRPILDRVKTALFDVLRPRIDGASVLDLFAGSGSVGIEALSQGASQCTFIDINDKACKTVRENLERCGFTQSAEVLKADAFSFLRKCKRSFDLIYVAPPQYKSLWLEALQAIAERPHLLTDTGFIVVQIDPLEYEEFYCSAFRESSSRKYGSTLLVWYEQSGENS
ncbi:MAG: 16S rRNA (guanine(966)-N(2))-methyltransferase RsmD [Deltaproteobacteria bacterium]|nr:16S rRNA (guanine(966)-N(2))-methyltransferase RsmD [Deltaproteobacteria bacterium]